MGDLRQYVGRRFSELGIEGAAFVSPQAFGELEVTPEDVSRAFPADLLGMLNAAAVHHNLISADEASLMVDLP
ncbi:MAG: hypothetical protein UX64_C0047G0003 [Microgenomates group bacterium GW2011_GWC2_46_7]|nr:MAG: hypothetical protein UX64_C0047G0003 [Microgenomates group bacterium GW2011_GWC2_46_7]